MDYDEYMRRAIEVARNDPDAPFGCVIVDAESGEIVSEGLNDAGRSPILHGEMVAIIDLLEARPDIDRAPLVLYTTAEPCPMCSGAIFWTGIPCVAYGTSIQTLKWHGWPQIDFPCEEVFGRASPGGIEVVGGVLEAECDALFEEAARRAGERP